MEVEKTDNFTAIKHHLFIKGLTKLIVIQYREVTYNLVGVHDCLEPMSNSQYCDISTKFIPHR